MGLKRINEVINQSTEDLLEERNKTHGDATEVYSLARQLQLVIRGASERNLQLASQAELDLICVKLARMVYNPMYNDNYKDIKGYTQLIEKRESIG